MTLEDHAKNVIYQQSIQISALSVALDAAKKELQQALLQVPAPAEPTNPVETPATPATDA